MDETTRRRPALLGEHRCSRPLDGRIGDRFQCFCGRAWRVVPSRGRRGWVLDGRA